MSKKTLNDLEMLFQFVPPDRLKATITNILLENLIKSPEHQPHKTEVYQDIYILFDFLDKQKI